MGRPPGTKNKVKDVDSNVSSALQEELDRRAEKLAKKNTPKQPDVHTFIPAAKGELGTAAAHIER